MMDLKPKLQTADPLYLQIERFMRQELSNGRLKAGDRLPATGELARQWGVGVMAVQKAMASLVADGLIERRPMKGTFVKAATESTSIAILTTVTLTQEAEYFHRAVVNLLRQELEGKAFKGWTCQIYDGLAKPPAKGGAMPPSLQRLAVDSLNHPFSAIIGLSMDTAKLAEAIPSLNLPAVSLNFSWQNGPTDIELDYHHFGRASVEFAAGRGCRRIVYLRTLDKGPSNLKDLGGAHEACKVLGLPEVEVHQIQQAFADGPQLERLAYERTMRLIEEWQAGAAPWPDAIMVSDDVATRSVVLALMRKSFEARNDASFKRPMLISMANEGIAHPYGIPVARYEIPIKGITQTLMDILRSRLHGDSTQNTPVKLSASCEIKAPTDLSWELNANAKGGKEN